MTWTLPANTAVVGQTGHTSDHNEIVTVAASVATLVLGPGTVHGDGATDDTANIQAALTSVASTGGIVHLPAATYALTAPIYIPNGVTLTGDKGNAHDTTNFGTTLKPLSTWAQGAFAQNCIVFLGNTTGAVTEAGLKGINIDGSTSTVTSTAGIYSAGSNISLENVRVYGCTGNGFTGSGGLYWKLSGVIATGNQGNGFNLTETDANLVNCIAFQNTLNGFSLSDCVNSTFNACRAEWNSQNGFNILGDSTATGTLSLTGTVSNRNGQHGIYVASTGTFPIIIANHQASRDGSTSTSAGYAGLTVSGTTTSPVVVTNLSVFPGLNDDNLTGNLTPQYGVNVNFSGTPTYVSVSNALLHAVTAGINGTITNVRSVATRTGSNSSPTAIVEVSDTLDSNYVQQLTVNSVQTTTFTATANQFYPVSVSSGNITVTLPTTPVDKTLVAVQLVTQDTNHANTITINAGGSDVIDITANTSRTVTLLYERVTLQYNVSAATWYTVSSDLPRQSLQAPSDWFNVKNYPYGAKGDATTDDTAAIQAAITDCGNFYHIAGHSSHGGTVYLPAGVYMISAPLIVNNSNIRIVGSGKAATQIKLTTGFSGTQNGISAAIFINNPEGTIKDLSLIGQGISASPVANGIEVLARNCYLTDIEIQNINGWGVELLNQNSTGGYSNNSQGRWTNVTGSAAGGFHLNGGGSGNTGTTVIGCGLNVGVAGSGTNTNLDALLLEDSADDFICFSFTGGVNAGTGSIIHIAGNGASTAPAFFNNCDIGGNAGGHCVLIETGTGTPAPHNIHFNNCSIQQSLIGAEVSGTSSTVHFTDCDFNYNATHGLVVSGSSSSNNIVITNCGFGNAPQPNGSGASGTNYDLNWSGTANGRVQNCYFASAITSVGVAGVQASVNVSSTANVIFNGVHFKGTGASSANWFTNTPAAALVTSGPSFYYLSGLVLSNLNLAQVFNVKAYGAVGNAITHSDGAMTASSATLTSASAAFTSADVGKNIVVQGAGAAGASLETTIATYVSATSVTTTVAATTAVTSATYYYGTDDSSAFSACATAIVAAGGGKGYIPASNYIAAAIPIQSGIFWEGVGFDASRIYLNSTTSNSMFTATAAALNSGSIKNLGLYGDGTPTSTQANTGGGVFVNISSTSTRRCIDLSAATSCQQFFVEDNFIRDFGVGYYGSANDRFIPFHGNRIWNCLYGAELQVNHPNFGITEFRYCGTGLWDGGNQEVDLQFVGTKFNYCNIGVNLTTTTDARVIFSGCHFFGNITAGAEVVSVATFSGCLFHGWSGGTTNLLIINGSDCQVIGNTFAGGHLTSAISMVAPGAGAIGLNISANTFVADSVSSTATATINIPNTSGWWYGVTINGNTFDILTDQTVLNLATGGSTPELVHPTITNNNVTFEPTSAGAKTLFVIGTDSGGFTFMGNTTFGKGAATGPVLSAAGAERSTIIGNRHRNPNATVYTLTTTDVDTRVTDNYGYVTENSGTATIASGTTSIVVTHGLARTPNIQNISAIPQASPGGFLWISTVTSTQFTINISAAPGANLAVSWYASAERG